MASSMAVLSQVQPKLMLATSIWSARAVTQSIAATIEEM